jgi:hypothetical protein
MKPILATILFLLMATTVANARIWTDTDGRKVEAKVVRVNPDQTVVLKTSRGKTVTVAFGTFVEADVEHLEYLLSRKGRGKLHAVEWSKLNEVFGVEIWQDDLLWDDPTAATAKRMGLRKESKTDFMENHRAYPLGKQKILGEPVYASALYGGQAHTDSIALVFLNQGDIPPEIPEKKMADQIEDSGMRIHDVLAPLLGKPERDSLGRGDLREKVWRWNWNGHAIMLSIQEGNYAALRIMPTDRADQNGRIAKLTDDELKKRMATCVERRETGDVIIRNIPMVNQGPKGYCSPATWERYLRYMDIPADMYLLALAAHTGVGGGTYSQEMIDATKNIISSNGRKLSDAGSTPTIRNVAKHIDKGLPIMWRLISTPAFQQTANDNTARRNGKEIKERLAGQAEDTGSGGHICLIIGYNKQTGEIAISDSWGARFAERWVPVANMEAASNGNMNIIRW